MLKFLTMQLYMKLNLKITANNQVGRTDDKKNLFVYSTRPIHYISRHVVFPILFFNKYIFKFHQYLVHSDVEEPVQLDRPRRRWGAVELTVVVRAAKTIPNNLGKWR